LLRGGQGHGRDLPRHLRSAQDRACGRASAGGGKDVDRLRQLRGVVRRQVRGPQGSALLDRGRGTPARWYELHRQRPLQAPRGQGREPDHRSAAVLWDCSRTADDRGVGSLKMLADHPIDVMLLATDLGVAREFYADKIGLKLLIETDISSPSAAEATAASRSRRATRVPARWRSR